MAVTLDDRRPSRLAALSIVAVAALLSGVAASGITLVVQNHLSQQDTKREVLGRLAGFRYLLARTDCPLVQGEPFRTLNEAYIVFANDQEVLDALEALRTTRGNDGELIAAVIKRMAEAAGVPITLDDAFLTRPMTPTDRNRC